MPVVALTAQHWPQVRAIYAAGITTGDATFETEPSSWTHWDAAHLPSHRLVELDGDAVTGWAAVTPVSSRAVYAGVVESSVYVHPDHQGRGVARRLMQALIASTEAGGVWTIQTGIFPENTASLALHERIGFRRVGVRERIGRQRMDPAPARWRDVVLLERRSQVVG